MDVVGIVLIVALVVAVICIVSFLAAKLCTRCKCFEIPVEYQQDDEIRTTTPEERSEQRPLLRPGSSTSFAEGGGRKVDIVASPHDCLKRDFGYEFSDGVLVDTTTGRKFEFRNQDGYERIGKVMNECIYGLLEEEDLQLRMLEGNFTNAPPRGFFFASRDIDSNTNGMLVLIHGSGAVRAGQWSRRLIINDSLESGSQLPYIKEAKKRDWSVVVMNTNQKDDSYSWYNKGVLFAGYEPGDHGVRVWKAVIERSPAKRIAIVAHSYGGHVTSCLLRKMGSAFKKKVVAIALTDSFCSVESSDEDYFKKVAKNWVTSKLPVGDSVGYAYDCERVSAGTTVHEETSWKSMRSVFAFIDKKFLAAAGDRKTVGGIMTKSGSAQETFTGTHPNAMPICRQETHNTHAQNEIEIEDSVNVPLLGPSRSFKDNAVVTAEDSVNVPLLVPSRSCKDNADVAAVVQPSGEIHTVSLPGCVENNEFENFTEGCRLGTGNAIYGIDANGQEKLSAISEEPFRRASSDAEKEECCTGKVTACDAAASVSGQSTKTTLKIDNVDTLQTPKEGVDTVVETHYYALDLAIPIMNHPVDDFLQLHSERRNDECDKPATVSNEGKSKTNELTGRKVYRNSVCGGSSLSENNRADLGNADQTDCLLSEATVGAMPQQPSCLHLDESRLKQPLKEADGTGNLATASNESVPARAAVEPTDCNRTQMDAVAIIVDSDSSKFVIEQSGAEVARPEHIFRTGPSAAQDATGDLIAHNDFKEAINEDIRSKTVEETVEIGGTD